MRENVKGGIVLALLLLVSGCGFALRGQQASLSHFVPELQLQVLDSKLEKLFLSSFASAQVDIVQTQAPTFEVLEVSLNRSPEAYGDDGQIRRERIQGVLVFQFSDATGEILVPSKRIHAQRDQYHYSAHDLANESESERLNTEVRLDLVNQALWHLRALSTEEAQ